MKENGTNMDVERSAATTKREVTDLSTGILHRGLLEKIPQGATKGAFL